MSHPSVDPRTPVIIGVGQLSQRVDRGEPSLEPAAMMAEVARRAASDSGGRDVLAALDAVRVVALISWRYRDPGAVVAAAVGAPHARTAVTTMGGNSPQALLSRTALDIAAGRADAVLICGAEAGRSRRAARTAGVELDWTVQDESVPVAEVIGTDLEMSHPAELARGIGLPVQVYPLLDVAVRAAAGRAPADHVAHIARLWSRFSAVAAANPHAWDRVPHPAEEIATPAPDNRMVGYPYTKLMNSNAWVDQAAAILLTSAERADALGVPRDRWVFPLAGTDTVEPFVSLRHDLHRSPAIRVGGRRVLELAGIGIDDVAHVDLYSCFPSAVQIGAAELGLDIERPLTVTGGLTFAGGPWNDYVTHAIATMVEVVRADPGSIGLCSANGGLVSKHAFGLYSTEPPSTGSATRPPGPRWMPRRAARCSTTTRAR
jgi:acetyl-CoA C-acetyltransferase